MTLEEFTAKLKESATNNITAFEGNVQLTANELADLKQWWRQLPAGDREKALALVKQHGVKVDVWK